MTEAQLAEIERAVGFQLPATYRRVALEFPFHPIGRDSVYWFFNDPKSVIHGTLNPLCDGGYDRAGWRDGLLTIGEGAAGDLHLLDTKSEDFPVYCLSHETHTIEPEWATFDSFVADWLQAPNAIDAKIEATQEAQAARWRRGLLVVGIILIICLVLPIVLGFLFSR